MLFESRRKITKPAATFPDIFSLNSVLIKLKIIVGDKSSSDVQGKRSIANC